MGEVIDRCAEARADKVASHEEIWSEEEDGEEKPAVVQVLVEEEGDQEETGFFDAEQDGWAGQHVRTSYGIDRISGGSLWRA